jgi:hypothetical protein
MHLDAGRRLTIGAYHSTTHGLLGLQTKGHLVPQNGLIQFLYAHTISGSPGNRVEPPNLMQREAWHGRAKCTAPVCCCLTQNLRRKATGTMGPGESRNDRHVGLFQRLAVGIDDVAFDDQWLVMLQLQLTHLPWDLLVLLPVTYRQGQDHHRGGKYDGNCL